MGRSDGAEGEGVSVCTGGAVVTFTPIFPHASMNKKKNDKTTFLKRESAALRADVELAGKSSRFISITLHVTEANALDLLFSYLRKYEDLPVH